MRAALAIALLAGACVATDDPVVTPLPDDLDATAGLTSFAVSSTRGGEVDICSLAAELPGDNACDETAVSVGVCLP